MWTKIKYMADRFLPVSKRRYINDMHAMFKVLDGLKEAITQQAEISSNLLSKFGAEEVKAKAKTATKNEKQANDIAFN